MMMMMMMTYARLQDVGISIINFGRISRFLRRNILSRVLRLELNETERNRTRTTSIKGKMATCSRLVFIQTVQISSDIGLQCLNVLRD